MNAVRNVKSPAGLLAGVWVSSFAICLLLPSLSFVQQKIELDTLEKALLAVSDIYSANLAVILGFFFHQRTNVLRRTYPESATMLGLTATLLWNAVAVGCFVATVPNLLTTPDAIKLATLITPRLSWLVAPLLGYFFAAAQSDQAVDR